MARHQQRPERSLMICPRCKEGKCTECIDILRLVYASAPVCQCKRKDHSGEPAANQVCDPEDGAVYAPGLVVSAEGDVRRNGNRDD